MYPYQHTHTCTHTYLFTYKLKLADYIILAYIHTYRQNLYISTFAHNIYIYIYLLTQTKIYPYEQINVCMYFLTTIYTYIHTYKRTAYIPAHIYIDTYLHIHIHMHTDNKYIYTLYLLYYICIRIDRPRNTRSCI